MKNTGRFSHYDFYINIGHDISPRFKHLGKLPSGIPAITKIMGELGLFVLEIEDIISEGGESCTWVHVRYWCHTAGDTTGDINRQIFLLAAILGQDCIALYFHQINSGRLVGPFSELWGDFNKAFFRVPGFLMFR